MQEQNGSGVQGLRPGAAALRVAAQTCQQCTHRTNQVEEGFFLCEQEHSAGCASAAHAREQRRLSPWAGGP
jgi:hypothetical protein